MVVAPKSPDIFSIFPTALLAAKLEAMELIPFPADAFLVAFFGNRDFFEAVPSTSPPGNRPESFVDLPLP